MTTITCDTEEFITLAIPKIYNIIKNKSNQKFIITIKTEDSDHDLIKSWLNAIKKWEYIIGPDNKKDLSKILRK